MIALPLRRLLAIFLPLLPGLLGACAGNPRPGVTLREVRLEQRLQGFSARERQLRGQLFQLSEELVRLEQEIGAARTQRAAVEARHQKTAGQLQTRLAELKVMEEDLQAAGRRQTEIRKQLAVLANEQARLQKAGTDLAALQRQRAAADEQLVAARRAWAEAEPRLRARQAEIRQLLALVEKLGLGAGKAGPPPAKAPTAAGKPGSKK